MPVDLLSVIRPSKFEGEHLQKVIQGMMKRRGSFRKKQMEDSILKSMVWMPYHRVQYVYRRSGDRLTQRYGKTGQGETALNAMLCAAVKSESEIFRLFRPNYLVHAMIKHFPQPEEIVGPTACADFDGILKGLLKRLNGVKRELQELRSAQTKSRLRIRRHSRILPLTGHLKRNYEKFSEKVARLNAIKGVLSLCLNVNGDLNSIEATGHSIFYYPTFVVKLKHKEDGTERYLIINLVKSGLVSKHLSCDQGLTKLCNTNSMCKEAIARVLTSAVELD